MKTKKYQTVKKLKSLQEHFDFLGNYETPDNEIHFVGNSLKDIDKEKTKLLRELNKVNKRRLILINMITKE